MNFPSRIPFGAIEIELRTTSSDELGGDRLGDYKVRDGVAVVRIDRDLLGGLKDTTIVHELAHAWIGLSSIKIEEEQEEAICDAIAQGVVQMMRAMGAPGGVGA